jgi:hypothetical protein
MGLSGSLFKLVLLLHVGLVVVGFGSNFVVSFLAGRARGLPARERQVLDHAAVQAAKALTTGPIVLSGLFGIVLVVLSDQAYTFAQMWVSLAFLVYLGIVAEMIFLVAPNARAIDELGGRLADGAVTTSKTGGPPREAVELEERTKRAAAFTGVVHLLWVLAMIDMVWKPGLG